MTEDGLLGEVATSLRDFRKEHHDDMERIHNRIDERVTKAECDKTHQALLATIKKNGNGRSGRGLLATALVTVLAAIIYGVTKAVWG